MSLVDSTQTHTESRPHQPLYPGTSLGTLTVVSSTPHQLVLRPSPVSAIVMILLGILITAGGLVALGNTLQQQRRRNQTAYSPGLTVIAIPFLGLALIGIGVMRYLTYRTIDGRRRIIMGGGSFHSVERRSDEFFHVQVTILSTEFQQQEVLNLGLLSRAGGIASIDQARTNSVGAGNLVLAAEEISRLLNLPLLVYGTANEGPPQLRAWIAANSRAAVALG